MIKTAMFSFDFLCVLFCGYLIGDVLKWEGGGVLNKFTKLVNCSLKEGCVPDGFKTAVIILPIKKATLPGMKFILKLVERVVAKQLLQHIHVHNLDNMYQSACKTGHSTDKLLLSRNIEVHLSLSRGKPTALILLDLLAAFDTIEHPVFSIVIRLGLEK